MALNGVRDASGQQFVETWIKNGKRPTASTVAILGLTRTREKSTHQISTSGKSGQYPVENSIGPREMGPTRAFIFDYFYRNR